jgi:phosphatidylglycerophosphatase C
VKTLVLFDFDGTLTTKDSLSGYIKHVNGSANFYVGLLALSPMLVGLFAGLIPNWRSKEIFMSWYLRGQQEDYLKKHGESFCKNVLPETLRPEAMAKLAWHKEQGHTVYLVSASFETWLAPFCTAQNIGLISTKLEYIDGVFTGKFASKNCHGKEKVKRVEAAVNVADYAEVYAYGDTKAGDGPMLDMATHSFYRKFN